ncbi:RIB43A-like with coiled-coils protein 1 [Trichonephila clavata]|uniref:RIB43A-like with coiled-coils protein 1 n=1 Tax=Trichonephila clavata TaxID=2740835 RepID=A0A8X6GY91_TRICU|nr:RIB43A-like with coiled-coils protein 1 [Trichonephila clavata]
MDIQHKCIDVTRNCTNMNREALVINRKRIAEEHRKRRIFNAKQRQIGLDVDALNYQVHEHLLARSRETEREKCFADEAKRQCDIAELLEQQKQEEIRENNKKIQEYRKLEQRPEYRKEFDLYDPNQKKKEHPPRTSDDDFCPISGVQKLEGEDLDAKRRLKKQKEQARDSLLQQMQEKRMLNFKQDKEKHDLENMMLEQDCCALQLGKEQEERHKDAFTKLILENKTLAHEKRQSVMRDKIVEDIEKRNDIQFNINSELLTEDPSVARSTLGPHRVVTDRWKGMSEKQLKEFHEGRIQQMVEKQRRKEHENYERAQWDEQLIHQENMSLLLEEEQKNREVERKKKLDSLNLQLAREQKCQQEYLDNVVYKNYVSKEYFNQFNTTSR